MSLVTAEVVVAVQAALGSPRTLALHHEILLKQAIPVYETRRPLFDYYAALHAVMPHALKVLGEA